MRDKQVAKNQLMNESTKLRPRFAKNEKSETRHKQEEKTLSKREELYLHTYSQDKIKDLKPGDHLCCLYRTEEETQVAVHTFHATGPGATRKGSLYPWYPYR